MACMCAAGVRRRIWWVEQGRERGRRESEARGDKELKRRAGLRELKGREKEKTRAGLRRGRKRTQKREKRGGASD